jgi:hypothetical protein
MQGKRRLTVVAAIALVLALGAQRAADPIVYITKTGTKYHTATCRYLRQSKYAIRLSETRGRYTPCSVCKPPTLK